jgi:uncharacterized membrane protein
MPPETPTEMPTLVDDPSQDVEDHPQIRDVNEEHEESLTPIERACKHVADATGAPLALFLAIIFQIGWVVVGTATHLDPYPFVFLLTVSNIIQLILIFIIAVAEKQSAQHAELRAEADHENISRLLHHQEVQEEILMRIAEQTQIDVSDIKKAIAQLMKAA